MSENYEGMEYSLLKEQYTTTKQEVLNALEQYISAAKSKSSLKIFERRSKEFKDVFIELIENFYNLVNETTLLEQLEPGWYYSCVIDDTGVSLYLNYTEDYNIFVDDDGFIEDINLKESFKLLEIKARFLTVEEYANIYQVTVGTVRQWIRRGKIRRAKKMGNEWRISELSDVSRSGYTTGWFFFKEGLKNIPQEYSFITDCSQVVIEQSKEESDTYIIKCSSKNEGKIIKENLIKMSTKEREKFELYLISNNEITAHGEYFKTIELIREIYQ